MNKKKILERMRRFYSGRWFHLFVLFVFICIPVLFYINYIRNNMLLVSGDGASYYSMRNYFNSQLWSGEFPYWNPYLEAGMPYPYGASDATSLYPIALLLSFLPPAQLSYVFYFVHLIIGAFFFYLYLQEIGCNRYASFLVSIMYELSVHLNGLKKAHVTIIVGVAFLPVILYFVQKYINTKKLSYLGLSAVCMGFQFLGAHTQIAFYTDVLVFVYLLIYVIKDKCPIKRTIRDIIVWFITYMGVIFAQLYTTALLFASMGGVGSESTAYERFLQYSIHPIKLIMMVFPRIFGNEVYSPMGYRYSSERDIELFLGVLALACIIFAIKNFFSEFIVKSSFAFMVLVFLYAMMAHIPCLAQILYQIPIIGGFRVASRALFIFIFFGYVLLCVCLSRLRIKDCFSKYFTFMKKFSLILLSLVAGISLVAVFCGSTNEEWLDTLERLRTVFLPSILLCCVILFMIWLYGRFKLAEKKHSVIYGIFGALVLCITLTETYGFSSATNGTSATYFDTEFTEIEQEIADSDYKVMDAFAGGGASHVWMYDMNSNIDKNTYSLNAYVAYNNARLYRMLTGNETVPFNYSGLFIGWQNMEDTIRSRNGVLSVLGVKYLVDSSGLLADNTVFYESGAELTVNEDDCVSQEVIVPESQTDSYSVEQFLVDIESDTYYCISFEAYTSAACDLHVDLYGEGYDSAEQQINLHLDENEKTQYLYIINSGSCPEDEVYLRLFANYNAEITVENLYIMNCNDIELGNYELYSSTEDGTVYLNPNAKDILFFVERVVTVSDEEKLYQGTVTYDWLNTAYVLDFDKELDLSDANTKITDIDFQTNSITANVTSDTDTFINFSQCYYWGWKAYVDGEQVPVYLVDDVIMGAEVPAGEHVVEFRYSIPYFMVAVAFSACVVIFWLIFFLIQNKKKITKQNGEV